MNVRNFFTLSIRCIDFNSAVCDSELLGQLRKLTLRPESGLNYELDVLGALAKLTKVNAYILTAKRNKELVGWALLSKESSTFPFPVHDGYNSNQGVLFEVFVKPDWRRQGIASVLLEKAKRIVGKTALCICPWDEKSTNFYKNFKKYNMVML